MKKDITKMELQDWDTNAEFYLTEVESPLYQIIHNERLETYELRNEGNLVLELGAATGFFSDCLVKMGKKVIATDFSYKMMKVAKENYPNINVVVASADRLPFKADVFDVIIANRVFHHLKAQKIFIKSLDEIQIVLKTGGVICMLDKSGSFFAIIMENFVMIVKKMIIRFKGKFSSSSSMNEPHLVEDDINLIRNYGFSIINRRFVTSIPLFVSVVFANTIEYLGNDRLAFSLRKIISPVIKWLENRINNRSLCAEQCIKFKKYV